MKPTASWDCLHRYDTLLRLGLVALVVALSGGCDVPSAHTFSRNYGLRQDLPVDPPQPHTQAEDDCANGGRLIQDVLRFVS